MKNILPTLLFVASFTTLLGLACGSPDQNSTASPDKETPTTNNTDQQTTTPQATEKTTSPKSETSQGKDLLYAWVDKLNIRDKPNTKGAIVSTVESDDALTFTGQKSDGTETIVLRGVAYDAPWLQVIAPDKKEGWVFGAAVKKEGEVKGNSELTDLIFDFPHFGSFDLTSWTKSPSKDQSGGDAEIDITYYQNKNQIIEVTKIDVGEYGYTRTHRLLDGNKKALKERTLEFTADADLRELTETVKDFSNNPTKQYKRKQTLKKHFMQLNALPQMVDGTWQESTLSTK